MKKLLTFIIKQTSLYSPLKQYNRLWDKKGKQYKELIDWFKKGKSGKTPHIIKQKMLKKYAKNF